MAASTSSGAFDRAETYARTAGFTLAVVFTPVAGGLGYQSGLRGIALLSAALVGGAFAGWLVYMVSSCFARGAGAGFLAFVQPSGKSTPYESTFSQGLALEAADDIAGAMEWFDSTMMRLPHEARVRVAAADLHGRRGQPVRAESLYREARTLTKDRAIELYCTQRVIDLLLGPLSTPHKAFPELRRVIDRFPGTREAEGAGIALSRLKADVTITSSYEG